MFKLFKKIFSVVKKIVFYSFLLYGYNLLAQPLKIIVPINLITVGSLTIFGVPALFSLIAIYVIMY